MTYMFWLFVLFVLLLLSHKDKAVELERAREHIEEVQQEEVWKQFNDDMDYTFGRGKYAAQRDYANEPGSSGKPRWMEPFAKVDMFGKPTVFSEHFMERD